MKTATNNIRSLREERGMSGKQLAERVRVSQSMISAVEIGRRKPSSELIADIADALGVNPPDLFDEEKPTYSERSHCDGLIPSVSIRGVRPSVFINDDDVNMASQELVVFSGDGNPSITLRFRDCRSIKILMIDIE